MTRAPELMAGPRRAASVSSPGHIDLLDVAEIGAPQDGEVAVELIACGICGSNLHHLFHPDLIPADRRHTAGALGHEMSGRVISVGPNVTTHEIGDLVALEPQLAAACGACDGCVSGSTWFCTAPTALRTWGFADRLVVRAAGAWLLPQGTDPLVATLMEALGCSVHAIRVSHLCRERRDDLSDTRVVVLGAGATGLLAVAAARILGASDVVCVARHPHQATLAADLGASEVLRDGEEGLAERLASLRPHLVVECVGGKANTLDLAARIVGPGGEISVLGLFDTPQTLDARALSRRQVRIVFPVVYGVVDGRHDFEIAAQILSAHNSALRGLITHRFVLDDIGVAFAMAADKSAGVIRVVVGRTDQDVADS